MGKQSVVKKIYIVKAENYDGYEFNQEWNVVAFETLNSAEEFLERIISAVKKYSNSFPDIVVNTNNKRSYDIKWSISINILKQVISEFDSDGHSRVTGYYLDYSIQTIELKD